MRLFLLGALLTIFFSTFAGGQPIPGDADKPNCGVPPDVFTSWFSDGNATLDGFVAPPNSLQFVPPAHCNFYQWAAHMFLWLTSPTPSMYGGSGRVIDSPIFFDVSAPDPQSGLRSFIPHFPGFIRTLNLRDAKTGPGGSPVLFDSTGGLMEVKQPETGPNGRPLIRNRVGDLIEIGNARVGPNRKPIFTDVAGRVIDYQLSQSDPGFHPIKPGSVISAEEFIIDGRTFFIDDNGTVRDGVGQADLFVQLAQTNSLVYYAITVNDVYAYFRTGVANNQISADKFPTAYMDLKQITDFAGMHNKTFLVPNALVVEIKTAWIEAGGLPDLNSYITIKATVPTFDRSNPARWVPNGWKTVDLALVGMHVVGSVVGNPEMVWATFEHLGNAPNASYTYNSTSGQKLIPQDRVGPWLFASSSATGPFNVPRQQYVAPDICVLSDMQGVCGASGMVSPSDTLRSKAWGAASNVPSALDSNTEIISFNYSVHDMMPRGDVRNKYFLVGTTWTDGGSPPNAENVRGATQLSNTTMETFQQGGDNSTSSGSSNCFSCHTSDQTSVSRIFDSLKPLF
jgi:hypothetical protein